VDAGLLILLGLTIAAFGVAYLRDPALPLRGLESTGRLLRGVWLELALGFVLAGLLDVLIPAPVLSRWLGPEHGGRGILVGWAAGLVMPGGPYLFFPVAANLFRSGVAPGPLIALLTAKTLVSPIRTLTYEAPLLGWPLTLARVIPGLLLPPVMGWIGQGLYTLLTRR
jgi:uncharacterized membrane protein YraQ (UPF0718 family)